MSAYIPTEVTIQLGVFNIGLGNICIKIGWAA